MKRFLIIAVLAIAVIASGARSQNIARARVPVRVLESFEKDQPGARDIHYEIEKDGKESLYQIAFAKDGKSYEAIYTSVGALRQLEEDIDASGLDQVIINDLNKKYHQYKIIEVSRIFRNHELYGYDVEIKYRKKTLELEYTKSGEFVRRH